MTQKENRNIFNEVKNNYKISYNLLIENWKPFVKTELFTLIIIIIIVIILKIFSIIYQLNFFLIQKIREGNGTQVQFQLLIYFNLIVILNLILLTFLTSQFGLANDIFTSGHMYAEFSSSFTYYRRHKFSYALLTLVIFWSEFLTDPLSILPLVALFEKSDIIPVGIPSLPSVSNFLTNANFFGILQRDLLLDFVQVISILVIVEILASITKTNSIKTAIKENFDILKKNKYLISITWLIFFIMFILPETLLNILLLIIMQAFFSGSSLIILGIIHLVIVLLFLFISMPFMVLLSTRMYVSLHNDQT